jgi:hypothetical protein
MSAGQVLELVDAWVYVWAVAWVYASGVAWECGWRRRPLSVLLALFSSR